MRNFLGHKFWARGYFVTTVGRDEEVIRAYIRNQELADRQLEQFELLLANVHLDEVDKELGRRGHAFVRYADDLNVSDATLGRAVMTSLRKLFGLVGTGKAPGGDVEASEMAFADMAPIELVVQPFPRMPANS